MGSPRSCQVKLNCGVGSLRFEDRQVYFEQPKSSTDGTTLATRTVNNASVSPTQKIKRNNQNISMDDLQTRKDLCDPIVTSPDVMKANEILRSHRLSSKNADRESATRSHLPAEDGKSTTSKMFNQSVTMNKSKSGMLRNSIFMAQAPDVKKDVDTAS